MLPEGFLLKRLEERRQQNALRQLRLPEGKVDFCSNDYLGIATNGLIEKALLGEPASLGGLAHGSMGSRLLAGNYALVEETERMLAEFHAAPAGLIFNSGYDANLGVLSCIPQKGDTVLYDSLCHASIRDGMRLSFARAFSFAHSDCGELEKKLKLVTDGTCFVVTESVFSMDGDLAPLQEIVALCRRYHARLIVDEAHATGIIGSRGEGLVQELGLQEECFARIHTFGKAVGCHGAIVLGSGLLREYLINFSRSFIYTTALPPVSVEAIAVAYRLLPSLNDERQRLRRNIGLFRLAAIGYQRLDSPTAIQAVIVPGNEEVKKMATRLQEAGLDVRPILSPTVPAGSERLRIVLHAFNTEEEMLNLIAMLR
ncbi:MAG TPA: 8-amino-7-oxononanoate synthase [Puia sp.]|jgi:8-amino-7-oxononanoate synthase